VSSPPTSKKSSLVVLAKMSLRGPSVITERWWCRRGLGSGVVVEASGDHRHSTRVAYGVVDDAPEDDVGVGVGHRVDDVGGVGDFAERDVRAADNVMRIPRAPSMEASRSGDVIAARAAFTARPSPVDVPTP